MAINLPTTCIYVLLYWIVSYLGPKCISGMLYSPQNLSKCIAYNKGFLAFVEWSNRALKKISDIHWSKWQICVFQEFLKELLSRYFQIHWKIHEHLNNFVKYRITKIIFYHQCLYMTKIMWPYYIFLNALIVLLSNWIPVFQYNLCLTVLQWW